MSSPSRKKSRERDKKGRNERRRSRSTSRRRRSRSRSRSRDRKGRHTRKSKSRSRSRTRGFSDFNRKEKAETLAKRVAANPIPAPERRVYVGGLAYDLVEEHIKVPFSSFGEIVMVDMPREPGTNRSKGFCFVEYTTREAAEQAMQAMNGYTIGGRSIKVGRSTPVGGMSSLGNAPAGVMALRVQQIREQALAAMRVVEKHDENITSSSSSTSSTSSSSATATSKAEKAKSDSTSLAAAKAALARKIYVGQVLESLSSEHIQAVFAPFGNILSIRLSTAGAKEGLHKGYGFIEYDTEHSANEAARLMNGFDLCGKTLKVTKAIA